MGVNKEEISTTIIELEKSFNERWSVGDNRGYLDAFAQEVSYFDPILENILVGWDKVIAWIESIYSNPHIVRSEYLNPQVHVSDNGDLAVLGYNLNTFVLDDSGEETTFEDIAALAEQCKFRDCKHRKEPGCAVRAAVEAGTLAPERLASFHKLSEERSAGAVKQHAARRLEETRRAKAKRYVPRPGKPEDEK